MGVETLQENAQRPILGRMININRTVEPSVGFGLFRRFLVVSVQALVVAVVCLCARAYAQELPLAPRLALNYGAGFDPAAAVTRPILSLAAFGALQEEEEGEEEAEPLSRGTLFQWRVEGGNAGGPDFGEPLVTDRPDFTESAVAVGRGVVQVEFGYTFTERKSDGVTVRTQTAGEQLLRAGFYADWLEFRLGMVPGGLDDFDFAIPLAFEQIKSGGVSTSTAGITDLYAGFKIALFPQEGNLPEMAVLPQVNIPTGSASFSSDRYEPGVNLVYGWALDESVSMAGSTQVNRRIDDDRRGYPEYAQSWALARGLSETVTAFAEWYAFFPRGSDLAQSEQYINGGLAWAITDDFQLDIRVGFGLNDESDDFFIGSGFSIRKL